MEKCKVGKNNVMYTMYSIETNNLNITMTTFHSNIITSLFSSIFMHVLSILRSRSLDSILLGQECELILLETHSYTYLYNKYEEK